MKLKHNYVLMPAILAFALLLNSCRDDIFGVSGSGAVVSEHRTVPDFDKVELDISGHVEIIHDSVFNIEVSEYENLISHISTAVIGGTLLIRHDPVTLNVRNSLATVKISMPAVSELSISGSGIISLNSGFRELNSINISGGGGVKTSEDIETSSLAIVISGSGNATITGTAEQLNTNISGSGNIKAFDLVSQNATCLISGSGIAFVNVVKNLNATISGSGKISGR